MPFFVCGVIIGFVAIYIVLHNNLVSNTYHRITSQKSGKPVDTTNIRMMDISLTEGTIKNMTTKPRLAKVRVLCWIMTTPFHLQEKAWHVRATWTKRRDNVLFMSSKETAFPTVGLNVTEGRDQLYWKTIRAFQYIHKHHFDDADWFLKADDDTYAVLDNLRYLLSKHDTEQPIYFGQRFKPNVTQGYMSGGAGYVLSKEALRRFVEGFRVGKCTHFSPVEDMALGSCMQTMGVEAGDSRDTMKRETFHPLPLQVHIMKYADYPYWYRYYAYYPGKDGPQCCSDLSVSYHYISPNEMYELEYLIHHLRPYGYQYRFNPDSPQNKKTIASNTDLIT